MPCVHTNFAHPTRLNRARIVTELAEGGGLVECIARTPGYSEQDAARFTRQLLEALRHLHGTGIVHMDLKPENLVMATKWVNDLTAIPEALETVIFTKAAWGFIKKAHHAWCCSICQHAADSQADLPAGKYYPHGMVHTTH